MWVDGDMGVCGVVTLGSVGTQGPHGGDIGVGVWVMSHVMRVDGDVEVCGVLGSLWVVTLGSVGDNGGEVPLGVTSGSIGTQGPHGG